MCVCVCVCMCAEVTCVCQCAKGWCVEGWWQVYTGLVGMVILECVFNAPPHAYITSCHMSESLMHHQKYGIQPQGGNHRLGVAHMVQTCAKLVTHTHTHTHTHIHTHTYTHTHIHTHTHTHTYTHTHIHTHTHTCTYTHMHMGHLTCNPCTS